MKGLVKNVIMVGISPFLSAFSNQSPPAGPLFPPGRRTRTGGTACFCAKRRNFDFPVFLVRKVENLLFLGLRVKGYVGPRLGRLASPSRQHRTERMMRLATKAKMRGITARERLFCGLYARLGDAGEAARRAGYAGDRALTDAVRLLARPDIRREVERQLADTRRAAGALALAGLERIAFGGLGDPVRLLTAGEDLSPAQLAALDLSAVSEMRRGRDGGLELRFCDRLAALRLLLEYGLRADGGGGAGSLLEALNRGAGALSQRNEAAEDAI